MKPQFLNYSLQNSLQRLNLQTLDCAILQDPFEATFGGLTPDMASLSATVRYRKYLERLAKAFEFYEDAVSRGLIRSYGISSVESMITEQSVCL